MKIRENARLLLFTLTAVLVLAVIYFSVRPTDKRPQEPLKPYPYQAEQVTFENQQANITLAGTLTLPSKGSLFPTVILISGSGAQNRDEEISGHKPFLVIADHLTRNGIAVLRFDDRGVGKSTGDFRAATTVDFASDVASAVSYLKTRKEIDNINIGLIGHSEGGVVAPMVASSRDDVAFIVLLAAPGIEIKAVLRKQQELIPRALGVSEADMQESLRITDKAFQLIIASNDRQKLKDELAKLIAESYDNVPATLRPPNMTKEQVIATQSDALSSPWYQQLLMLDPAPALQQVTCPVLALNGEKDLQVTPKDNLQGISKALAKGGNTNVTTMELPGLNHLFQECETGSIADYETIEQTFSPTALQEMSDWILNQVK